MKRREKDRRAAPDPRRPRADEAMEQTFAETRYLRKLAAERRRVRVEVSGREEFTGEVEYFDRGFVRITRSGGPNLFVYKRGVRRLVEEPDEAPPES